MSLQISRHGPLIVSTVLSPSTFLPYASFFYVKIPSGKQTKRSALQDLPFLFSTADLLLPLCPGNTLTHVSYSPDPGERP